MTKCRRKRGQNNSPAGNPRGCWSARWVSALAGLDRIGELGSDLEQVAHHAVVGDFEDGRLFILVDRDDGLRGLHARAVLDRAGDAQRDVELGRYRLAGPADLELARVVAR